MSEPKKSCGPVLRPPALAWCMCGIRPNAHSLNGSWRVQCPSCGICGPRCGDRHEAHVAWNEGEQASG